MTIHEKVLTILEAAEENCRNGGDWAGWENAQHLLETYREIDVSEIESAVRQIDGALIELKEYEAQIRLVLTANGNEHLVCTECPDGDVWLYKTPWNAWMDRNGERPWLACGRFMKTGI
jgi:hypothetical protein